jgi:arylsulfatase A-like enzyme
MGQIRHGSATTTHAVRAAIQRSQASLTQLSKELGINPKTVAKWHKRTTVEDLKAGPAEPRSTVLTEAEEVMIVALRKFWIGIIYVKDIWHLQCILVQLGIGRTMTSGAGPSPSCMTLLDVR